MWIYKWRDVEIVETYTIPAYTASDNTYVRRYLSIAKSWHKVSKVTMTGTSKNSSSRNYAAFNMAIADKDYGSDTNPSYHSWFWINYWPNNTWNTSRIQTGYNWTATNVIQISNSDIVFDWTNITSMEMTPDTYNFVINWNTYAGDYSSTNKRDIEYVFSSSTVCLYVRQNSWTASDITVTVTYEPIS